MTPERASAVAHGELPFHNPLSPATVESLLDLLALEPADRVLDVGCGRGELLIRIAERARSGGIGVDASEELIALARQEAAARVPDAHLTFERRDADAMVAPAGSFALAACIGATHALGGLRPTLERLSGLVRPGGYLLVGEGFWQHEPGPELLSLLGAARDELTTLPELLVAGAAFGLAPVHLAVAGDDDWRRYEWTYVFNLDRYLREHPGEPGLEELRSRRDRIRGRRLLAAREGEALGFALVCWRRG